MKKAAFVTLLLAVLMLIASCSSSSPSPMDKWDGTAIDTDWFGNDPDHRAASYTLSTAAEFAGLASLVDAGNDFKGITIHLAANLDLGSKEWDPIGDATFDDTQGYDSAYPSISANTIFKGHFNGNGHEITGLRISSGSKTDGIGLFAAVSGTDAVIENIRVKGTIDGSEAIAAGFIAGIVEEGAAVRNCTVLDGSAISSAEAGGIVGSIIAKGTVTDCTNYADVTATTGKAGGIAAVAYFDQAKDQGKDESVQRAPFGISNSSNHGRITGVQYSGGIIGLIGPATISGCSNYGDVIVDNAVVGGIVGQMYSGGIVSGCHNSGTVLSESSSTAVYGVGGIAGWIRYSDAKNYNTVLVCAIENSTNEGAVTANGATGVGGVIGMIYWAADIAGCTSSGDVISLAGNMVGGFAGGIQYDDSNYSADRSNGIRFRNCSVIDEPMVTAKGSNLGAFIGHSIGSTASSNDTAIVPEYMNCSPTGSGSGIDDPHIVTE